MKTKPFSEQITEALNERKITIKELANKTGFAYDYINDVLHNEKHLSTMALHQLEQIADVLEMEIQLVPVGKQPKKCTERSIKEICDCIPPIHERDKEVSMYQISLNLTGFGMDYIRTEQLMKVNAVYEAKKGEFSLADASKLLSEATEKLEEYKTKYPLSCKSTK